MPVPMVEIPSFGERDALSVEALFDEGGIEYRRDVLHLGATEIGGHHAYTFWVPEEQFAAAIEILKEWFQLRSGKEPVSGVCPACGARVEGVKRCPDCDLNLSGDYSRLESAHPFVRFLMNEGLL